MADRAAAAKVDEISVIDALSVEQWRDIAVNVKKILTQTYDAGLRVGQRLADREREQAAREARSNGHAGRT